MHSGHDHDHDHDHHFDCGVSGGRAKDYNMTLHVIALVVIWALSLLGCAIPVLGRKIPSLRINETALSCLMAFGVGVVIATALIHMIPPAIEKLNNPCLGMAEKYEALAMAIVLATMLLMMILETELGIFQTKKTSVDASSVKSGCVTPTDKNDVESAENFHDHEHAQVHHTHGHGHAHGHAHGLPMIVGDGNDSLSVRNYISTIIFECGVYMHSILIGVDLGVLAGSEFKALFAALAFHQFFEGIAVGNLSSTAFTSSYTTVVSVVLYSLMTPVGILIGILVSSSYSETSSSALWAQGILDAVAGGILLYTGLVELLSSQFTSNAQFQSQKGTVRGVTYGFLLLGAFAMAMIGKWA